MVPKVRGHRGSPRPAGRPGPWFSENGAQELPHYGGVGGERWAKGQGVGLGARIEVRPGCRSGWGVTSILTGSHWDPKCLPTPTAPCAGGAAGGAAATGEGLQVRGAGDGRSAGAWTIDTRRPPRRSSFLPKLTVDHRPGLCSHPAPGQTTLGWTLFSHPLQGPSGRGR